MAEKLRAGRAGNERAFVDPSGYHSYLERSAALIDRTLAEQGHDGGCASLLGNREGGRSAS
jgi:hypothetical protein